MMNNVSENYYAVYKDYYQLCKKTDRKAEIKIHYSIH